MTYEARIFTENIREAQRFGKALREAKDRSKEEYDRLQEEFEKFIAPMRGHPQFWQPVYLAYDDARYA